MVGAASSANQKKMPTEVSNMHLNNSAVEFPTWIGQLVLISCQKQQL